MELQFLTKNKHKVEEVSKVMEPLGFSLMQLAEEKIEPKEMSLMDVCTLNAKEFYHRIKKPIIVDDTGIIFEAFPGFPGNHPKLMFNLLGYKGLLKLLEGENRSAYFVTAAAFYDGKELITASGRLYGEIADSPKRLDADVMPYERIFLHKDKLLANFSRDEKNRFSHRAIAFKKLGELIQIYTQSYD